MGLLYRHVTYMLRGGVLLTQTKPAVAVMKTTSKNMASSAGMASKTGSWMSFDFRDDRGRFTTRLPGWAMDDVNDNSRDLRQMAFLRSWKILSKLECIREAAKPQGFIDLLRFEESEHTYMKCVGLERVMPHADLLALNANPYGYDVTVESAVGRVGKTSFQIDNSVSLEATGEPMFRSSLIYVCVDKKDLKVCDLPEWWTAKYREATAMVGFPPLRVNLPRKPGVADDFDVIHRGRYQIRFGEADRFGHSNNKALLSYCADAVACAHSKGCIPGVSQLSLLEGGVRRIEVDFVDGSVLGETLTASVMMTPKEPNIIYTQLHNNGKLVVVQKLFYDLQDLVKGKL